MQDTEWMTLGMWIDYIIEWNAMNRDTGKTDKKTGKRVTTRKDTQTDFDAF